MNPNSESSDHELLRAYLSEDGREQAFSELVRRHLPTVWSAATRITGDAALAQDVAQEVFTHLAVHAGRLTKGVVLGAWLHRHTCFTATKAVRSASRRRLREAKSVTMNTSSPRNDEAEAAAWAEIAPHLDAAIASLPPDLRNVLVLRFFENQNYRNIAAALGTSEDAARMRTNRALEKLRSCLGKRHALLTVAVLSGLLQDHAVASPAAKMGAQIAKNALAATATAKAVTTAAGFFGWIRSWSSAGAVAAGAGALLVVSLVSVGLWRASRSKAPSAGVVASSKNRTEQLPQAPAGKPVEVHAHYFYVPQTLALTLTANRWHSDDDPAIFEQLIHLANTKEQGVALASHQSLVVRSGQRGMMENITEVPHATSFETDDTGTVVPEDMETTNVGTTTEVDFSLQEHGEAGDLVAAAEHHFAKPAAVEFSADPALQGQRAECRMVIHEFFPVKTSTTVSISIARPLLISATALPEPGQAQRHLFCFLTVHPR